MQTRNFLHTWSSAELNHPNICSGKQQLGLVVVGGNRGRKKRRKGEMRFVSEPWIKAGEESQALLMLD